MTDNEWKELVKLARINTWKNAPHSAEYYAEGNWYDKDFMRIEPDGLYQAGYSSIEHLKSSCRTFMFRGDWV